MSAPTVNELATAKRQQPASARLPRITVVVCSYNRAALLADALRSLLSLTTDEQFAYDVLVVDNNSNDNTQQVVAQLAATSAVPLQSVVETEKGVVAARNRGLREAQGEWIAFFDDDQRADPRWLLELLQSAQQHDCLCVGGAVALELPAGNERQLAPFCRMLLSETVGMHEPRPYDRRTTPGTGNVMIHRRVLDQVGPFNPAMRDRGEDTELFLRILAAEFSAWYTPRAIIHHIIPADRLNDDYFLSIARKMGTSLACLERDAWGWLFTGRWLLRAAHAYGWFWPQARWAQFRGNADEILGWNCRMALSNSYLSRGWNFVTGQS